MEVVFSRNRLHKVRSVGSVFIILPQFKCCNVAGGFQRHELTNPHGIFLTRIGMICNNNSETMETTSVLADRIY